MARTKTGKSPHSFGQVPAQTVPRSTFNLSHGYKTTFDADFIVPFGVWDVIPGDSWNVKSTIVARLATPLHPLQDNLYIDTFYFFVPYRILWDNFEKFMGAQDDPGDTISFTIPQTAASGVGKILSGDLGNYMGIPINYDGDDHGSISALPFRAYHMIWNDWFRDENLQDKFDWDTDNGPDSSAEAGWESVPLKRQKKHDYFTSALPWPQKGATPVSLPLGTSAPVVTSVTDTITGAQEAVHWASTASGTLSVSTRNLGISSTVTGDASTSVDAGGNTYADPVYIKNLEADLSTATAATINELRLAFQTQKLLERDARSGTRYVETLKAHWGVTFPDYTAQRPVYLGGGSQIVGITPVPQQSASAATPTIKDAQGNLTGYGYSSGQTGFTKSFVEHGVILALMNARGDISYSQGIDRYWSKLTRYDFYYPVLSGIGEQSIINREIWLTDTATDLLVFGYTGRYNEYRFQNSKVTGLMAPDAPSTLASWNLSEDFASLPALGSSFIASNTGVPLDRAIAVPAEPHFICDIWHDIKAARPLPLYGIPGQGMNF